MSTLKQLLLSPIRFYPELTFGSSTVFQNPDNRVSHGYNWDGVTSLPYALPIPKQWPDGQPGIDFMINNVQADGEFYANLYDSDDTEYASLNVDLWVDLGDDRQYRVFLDGLSGDGIAQGYYTIKLFATADDTFLLESEALLVSEWFDDMIPFEYSNFENDFGIVYDNSLELWTGRILAPINIYDPTPQFEKEVYKDDPGTLTTLRSTVQRVFNFDSGPVPVHVAELFAMAFTNSELYLDRMRINSEEAPEAELIEGTNLKQITGTATLVDFNSGYEREKVETTQTDQSLDWSSENYPGGVITGNSFSVNAPSLAGDAFVSSVSYNVTAGDIILVRVVLTDDGSSDIPSISIPGISFITPEAWGTHYLSLKVKNTGSITVRCSHLTGQDAVYTTVLTLYSID